MIINRLRSWIKTSRVISGKILKIRNVKYIEQMIIKGLKSRGNQFLVLLVNDFFVTLKDVVKKGRKAFKIEMDITLKRHNEYIQVESD